MPDEDIVDDFKSKVKTKKKQPKIDFKKGLSSGSTLLNLACSARANVAFIPGHYYFVVGDSASGKSFLSLTCLAEAAINNVYDDYRLIYDNAEDGALMNMAQFFGEAMASRLQPPCGTVEDPVFSSTVEEFYYNLDDCLNKGPCVYILDSMDALDTEDDEKKFVQRKKAYRADKEEVSGSYGMSKAKANSSNIRRAHNKLKDNGSILIVIAQTRDNVGTFSFEKKTRSGGHSLRFYATLEMWSSIREKITKNVKGKNRQIGITCKIQLKKNRITGRECSVEVPIYYSHGLDDIGSCIDYLIEEKHWSKTGSTINAKELDYKGTYEKLVEKIEDEGLENDVKLVVTEVWQEVEAACAVKRKQRY